MKRKIKIEELNKEATKNFKKYWAKLHPPILQLLFDVIFSFLAFYFYLYIRFSSGFFEEPLYFDKAILISAGLTLVLYWLFIFWLTGLYRNWYVRSPFEEFFTIIRAIFIGTFLIFFFVILDSSQSPRLFFLIYFCLMVIFVAVGRLIARKIQKKLRILGLIKVPAIIIGNFNKVDALAKSIENAPAWGYEIIGIVSDDKINQDKIEFYNSVQHYKILGNIADIERVIDDYKPAEVLLTFETQDHSLLLDLVALCKEKGIIVKISPDLYTIFMGQVKTLPIYGIPLIEISPELLKPYEAFIKRALDIIISLVVLIVGLPFWFIIAILIKIDSPGPVLFKQKRVGKDGMVFTIYKFRTMVEDADKEGPRWTEVNDKRVTKFGRFLRKSHLDEIPQFWNVLIGDMSIVGPRPEQVPFVEKFSKLIPYYKRRLKVRPGITGWWQIKYKTYEESLEEIESRTKDDFYYIENFSLRLDLEIIIRTILIMLKGHGQT